MTSPRVCCPSLLAPTPRRRLPTATALLSSLVAMLGLLTGCTEDRVPQNADDTTAGVYDLTFPTPEFPSGRSLDTVINVDLDDDGRLEYIVTSIGQGEFAPPTARADFLQIYRFDTVARRYRIVAQDSLLWIVELKLRDVTGDRLPDLTASVYSGGNDIVASSGLYVYSGDGGSPRAVFAATHGDPTLATIEGVRGEAILMRDLLWPEFASHAEAAAYVSDIMVYKDGRFTSARNDHAQYFLKEAEGYLAEYRQARQAPAPDTVGVDSLTIDSLVYTYDVGLFRPAALTLLSFAAAHSGRSLRSFWDSERDFLRRRLAIEQFAVLDSLYASAVNR